jgi:predicted DNA-binding ribbon-helix-helix protein
MEASENLTSLNIDRRSLTKTGRTYQLGTRVKKEFLEKLKEIAYEERLKMVEVLERSLEAYLRERNKV